MKKIFASKKFMSKIALILVCLILFQFVAPKKVNADIGGTLLSPIVTLLVFLADGATSILQNTLTNSENTFEYIDLTGNKTTFLEWLIVAIGVAIVSITAIVTHFATFRCFNSSGDTYWNSSCCGWRGCFSRLFPCT